MLHLLILLILDTGVRISEAIGILWEHIDFDNCIIDVFREAVPPDDGSKRGATQVTEVLRFEKSVAALLCLVSIAPSG